MKMKKNKVFYPVGPSTWDLRTWLRRVARFVRKTASTPSGPALTQVGRAPSLTLEALVNSSSRENLTLWGLALRAGLKCPEASPGPGRGQAGKGDRHSQARGRVRLGPAEWRRGVLGYWPWGAAPAPSPLTVALVPPPGASACPVPSLQSGQACRLHLRADCSGDLPLVSEPVPLPRKRTPCASQCLAPLSNSSKTLCLGWEG